MQLLNNIQIFAVSGGTTSSGGAVSLGVMLNLWAGYHNWNYRNVIAYNAIASAIPVGIICSAGISPEALAIGLMLGGAYGAVSSAILYNVGSFVAAMDKESSSAHA